MIDHVSIGVSDLAASARFYESVLGVLGYVKLEVRLATVGFGKRYPEFWLNHRPEKAHQGAASGAHVCLRAANPDIVDGFHAAALAAGGESDGAPGLRPQHGNGYYAAFIRDHDGNRIEAVTFLTGSGEGASRSGARSVEEAAVTSARPAPWSSPLRLPVLCVRPRLALARCPRRVSRPAG